MKKTLLGIAVLVLALGAILYFKQRQGAPLLPPGALSSSSEENKTAAGAPAPAKVALPKADGVAPTLLQFYQEEAKSLDSTQVNAEEAEAKAVAQANAMGAREILYTKELVLAANAPANQRILAIYLLTKTGAASNTALKDIVMGSDNLPPAEVHSTDEIKNTQSKAFSLQAAQELFHRAQKGDAAALAELRKAQAEAKDPELKAMLDKAMKRLSKR